MSRFIAEDWLLAESIKETIIMNVKTNEKFHIDTQDGYRMLEGTFDPMHYTVLIGIETHRDKEARFQNLYFDYYLRDLKSNTDTPLHFNQKEPWPFGAYLVFIDGVSKIELGHFDGNQLKQLWAFDASRLGTYQQSEHFPVSAYEVNVPICVVEGILWIQLYRGVIMGIDIETAHIRYFFNLVEHIKPYCDAEKQTTLYVALYPKYDAGRRKIVGFLQDFYYEIDLNMPKVHLVDGKNSFCTNNVFGAGGNIVYLHKQYFYTFDWYRGGIVRINIDTHQIEYIYERTAEGTHSVPVGLIVTDKYLYIKYLGEKLDIFEWV